ncbi:MAG TPA: class I SAM-dependent methyltransferase [Thermoanaerobaculia bacterium]|jgi:SAM-dependent methyltransferase|nr:class I SAM-dependent methyltransferase [Thermoanaerobaculia bacterium]
MTWLDRLLRDWRIRAARAWIPANARILDIGCGDGALLRAFAGRSASVTGIDPAADGAISGARLIRASFPKDLPAGIGPFDAITLLAMLEHVPESEQPEALAACAALLDPRGVVIVTLPSPWVDPILDALRALRLIDGMALEEHYGFDPRKAPRLFAAGGFECVARRRFQLGFNNLFVFRLARNSRNAPATEA